MLDTSDVGAKHGRSSPTPPPPPRFQTSFSTLKRTTPFVQLSYLFFLFSFPAESEQYSDSNDLLAFLRKPKLEVYDEPQLDQEKETKWPIIKKDPEERSLPSPEKFSKACIISEPKVKVHFLGLKKVSIDATHELSR